MLDRDRLVAILGMLGSHHSGEVLNATSAAEKTRRDARLSWHDIVAPPAAENPPASFVSEIDRDLALLVENVNSPWLHDWQREFICSVLYRSFLSEKQEAIARRIASQLRRNGRASA